MKKYKLLRIDPRYDQLIKQLVALSDISTEKEYVEMMIDYFFETGINPKARNKPITAEISKLYNQINWFIKDHEKKKIQPLIREIQTITTTLINLINKEATKQDDISAIISSNGLIHKQILDAIQNNKTNKSDEIKSVVNEFLLHFQSGISNYKVEKRLVQEFRNKINTF